MVSPTALRTDVNAFIDENGLICRFRHFTPTYSGASYDDYATLATSGSDVWTSGLLQPLSRRFGSKDASLLQEGKLLSNDSKLYVKGNIQSSGTLKIQIGSPSGEEYVIVNNPGTVDWTINNISVYKTLYVRVLLTGSILGE